MNGLINPACLKRTQINFNMLAILAQNVGRYTVAFLATSLLALSTANAAEWVDGDVFVGIAGGAYEVYDSNGVLKEGINTGLGGFTTGCSLNNAEDKLYTTNFSATKVVVFDNAHPHNVIQTIDTALTSPGGQTESVVFDAAGNFYTGHPDGNDLIHKYNAAGVLLDTYDVAVDSRGTDWIDLASDQCTMFYTSEGRSVQRYDVCTKTQLPNFATLPGSGNAFALRLLPPGDGTGGLLVADGSDIKRLNSAGVVVQTYDAPGEDSWFALNRDPNGTSFWSGGISTNIFYRFNTVFGNIEAGPINTGGSTLAGICVKGELTPTEICDDGIDNDDDGLLDCDDADCLGFPGCGGEICSDFMDNDDDGLIDCSDPDCISDFVCAPPLEICTDNIDNDADNLIDCADPECIDAPNCENTEPTNCDFNDDDFIDFTDVQALLGMLGTSVTPGATGDLDNDGVLTILDARLCVLDCTLSKCDLQTLAKPGEKSNSATEEFLLLMDKIASDSNSRPLSGPSPAGAVSEPVNKEK